VFWLIENKKQLEEFQKRNVKEAFLEIIPYSPFLHPAQNSISCIYIRPLQDHKGYLFPIFHTEVEEKLFEDEIFKIIKSLNKIYCRDKKELLHYFPLKQLIDITLQNPFTPQYTPAHEYLYRKYPNKQDVNVIVPIVKHYEYCEATFEELEHLIGNEVNEFFNHKASWVFYGIEQAGLTVEIPVFNDYFNQDTEGIVYTQYNFKTLTSRPSNNFNGINFAALNKENGCRKSFIPRHDKLIEIDIRAYHPTLLSKLAGFDLGEQDIYSYLQDTFKVNTRDDAKKLILQQMYGGILPQYQHLDFFKQVQMYVDDMWDKFQYQGFIECPISKFKFHRDKLENMNPQKLLSYLLQSLESANNIVILWEMFKILKGKKTKLILYTYDSFLLDWDSTERNEIKQILNVFKQQKLNISIKHGTSYDF
jgi:hypothetical protein